MPWKTLRIATITPVRIDAWLRGSDEWSASTRRTYLAHLSEIFAASVKAGHVEMNPCTKVTLPREKAASVRVYAPGEVERLLHLAWTRDRSLVPGLAIGLFAGLRPQSELARLDWRDVRIEEGILVAHSTKVRSASRRMVPIATVLASWLLDAGLPVPEPAGVEAHAGKRGYARRTWAIVSVDLAALSGKSKRLNISLPERVLRRIDAAAAKNGESRSGFIARAALQAA